MEAFIKQCPLGVVFLILIIGFVFLIKGADFFVDGSSSIAKRFHVPPVIIGLTIVAMGTSLPETAVSVTASLANNNTLAISNVIGSNIFNLMMVIGVCSLLCRVEIERETIVKDIPFSAFCAILLIVLGFVAIGGDVRMSLGRWDGIILLIIFAIYILSLIRRAVSEKDEADAELEEVKELPLLKSILLIIIGGVGIAVGGDMTVASASSIATSFGMSQTLVGLTIVSVGTSLPELVTSIVAARKNEVGMALGNAIGSNVFNILMVLGIAAAISPLAIITENLIDIAILLVFSLIVWLFAATKRCIERFEGIVMILLYIAFAVYIVIR